MIATRLRLPRNQAILSAFGAPVVPHNSLHHSQLLLATGIGAGYFFTQGFVAANLSKLRAEIAAARMRDESTNDEFVSSEA